MSIKISNGISSGRAKCRICDKSIKIGESAFVIDWDRGFKQFHESCFEKSFIKKIFSLKESSSKKIIFSEEKHSPFASTTIIEVKTTSKRATCRYCDEIIKEGLQVSFSVEKDSSNYHLKCAKKIFPSSYSNQNKLKDKKKT